MAGKAGPARTEGKGAYTGPQVLLVDDEPQILEALTKLLGRQFQVRGTTKPKEALGMLKERPADVVVSDQMMPGMSGMEFLKEVSRITPEAKKIILTGAYNVDTVISSINEVQVDFFFSKPIRLQEVTQAIEKLWNNRQLEMERNALYQQNAKMVEQLRGLNAQLEKKVRQRTKELSKTNRKLEDALGEIEGKNRTLTGLNKTLNIQASVDALTGVFNRREFDHRLSAEWARFRRHHRPLSIIMLDIDFFKKVNDQYGHPCGDTVLKTLGQIMNEGKRRQDIVCRYGGEEFVVLLPETPIDAAFHVAETLRGRVGSHRFKCGRKKIELYVSLGVAGALEQNPKSEDAFVQAADAGLYRAKQEGRNRTVILDHKNQKKIIRMSAPETT